MQTYWNMRAIRHKHKCHRICRRCQHFGIRKKHRRELQVSGVNTQTMRKVGFSTRIPIRPDEVRTHSLVQKSQKIQYGCIHQHCKSTEIEPKTDIRVLGLQIDTKLKWGPHVRKTQKKMVEQSMALTKISTSTWGATFTKARQVYSAVVRPVMTYGSTVWHMPKEVKKSKTSTSKLSVMQNNCLRIITGAFKATPIPVLEAETYIAPIDVHLDTLQAQARHRLRAGGQSKGKRLQKSTPGELKNTWAKNLLIDAKIVQPPKAHPPWPDPSPAHLREVSVAALAR